MATKTVKIVRKTNKAAADHKVEKRSTARKTTVEPRQARKPRTPHFKVDGKTLPLNVPLNIKVSGERVMRKGVVLAVAPSNAGSVLVKTGRRGRPAVLAVEHIEKFRVL